MKLGLWQSMRKVRSHTKWVNGPRSKTCHYNQVHDNQRIDTSKILSNSSGFVLVEALLAIAILSILLTSFVTAYSYGTEASLLTGARNRAGILAEEGLEATRSIRDEEFSNLVDGTYGIAISANKWTLTGSSDTNDIFTRTVNIATVDADRKLITSTVNWQQNGQRTGSVVLKTYLTNWAALVAKGGTLVYGNFGTPADGMKYQTYSPDGTWSSAQNMADVDSLTTNKALYSVRVYASATRNEKIAISRHYNGFNQYIYGQVYDGSSWGDVQLMASWFSLSFLDVQNYDGTYLNNGDFMVVFSDNTTTPKMRTWNGSSWSSQVSLKTVGGIPSYIVASARPNTNEVMVATYDQSNDTNTEYFNGGSYTNSNWSNATEHDSAGLDNQKKQADFAWSPISTTKGLLIYRGTNNKSIRGKIWTANGSGGGSWGGAVNSSGNQTNNIGSIKISTNQGANEFIICDKDIASTPITTCYKGNSTLVFTTVVNGTIATNAPNGIQRTFDMGLEKSGAAGVIVYSDNTNTPKFKTYTSSTSTFASSASSVPTNSYATGITETVRLIPSTESEDIMTLVADNNRDLYSILWDGTANAMQTTPVGNAYLQHGVQGIDLIEYWYDFAWDLY